MLYYLIKIMGSSLQFEGIRVFSSGVSDAKYLAFGTLNTKKPLLWDILNAIKFDTHEQYRSIFGTVRTDMLKKYFFIHFLSLLLWLFFLLSLVFFFFLSLLVPYLLSLLLLFFFFFLLQPFTSPFFFSLSLSCVHFPTILFHTFSLNKIPVGVL